MDQIIDWRGKSGTVYRYWFSGFADFYKVDAGNYMFVKQLPNGNYLPVYIGQAASLAARLPCHERIADAKKAGATLVMSHTTQGGEAVRLAEEKDLIQQWSPVLNTQHKQAQ
jgi:hypothetical protein